MDLLPSSSRGRRRRRWLLLLAAASLAGYGAYRLYHLPSVAERRRRLTSLLRSLASISQALARSAEAASLVSSDLALFLSSDSDDLPNSLRQLSKIARSPEVSAAISRVSEAVTAGVVRGTSDPLSDPACPGTADRILDKVLSPAGSGFASAVAGSFARNLVVGFYDSSGSIPGEGAPEWVRAMCSDEARRLMGECVQTFVATAVEVYLKKTADVNTYDEMFSGLTNPTHAERVKEVLVAVCSGATETLVRTSHQVLTAPKPRPPAVTGERTVEVNSGESRIEEENIDANSAENHSGGSGGGWLSGMSSALAVPGHRRFVLDVTGRVTFETIRSVLEFTFWRMYEGVGCVGREIAVRVMEVIRYASAKSMLIVTVCFSMLLHLAFGSRLLVTA